MKKHKTIEKLDKVANEIQHFPKGKKISELAEKLGMHRSTLYDYINTLELMGRAYYQRGTAYPERPKESIQPEGPASEETVLPGSLREKPLYRARSSTTRVFWALPRVSGENAVSRAKQDKGLCGWPVR